MFDFLGKGKIAVVRKNGNCYITSEENHELKLKGDRNYNPRASLSIPDCFATYEQAEQYLVCNFDIPKERLVDYFTRDDGTRLDFEIDRVCPWGVEEDDYKRRSD